MSQVMRRGWRSRSAAEPKPARAAARHHQPERSALAGDEAVEVLAVIEAALVERDLNDLRVVPGVDAAYEREVRLPDGDQVRGPAHALGERGVAEGDGLDGDGGGARLEPHEGLRDEAGALPLERCCCRLQDNEEREGEEDAANARVGRE